MVNQHKKASMLLHEFQREKRAIAWPSPKKTKELIELLKEYDPDLVYDQVQTNGDRVAHCIIRDPYKAGEYARDVPISTHHMLLGVQDLERHDATSVPRSTNTIVDGHQQCLSKRHSSAIFFLSLINNHYSQYKKILSFKEKYRTSFVDRVNNDCIVIYIV